MAELAEKSKETADVLLKIISKNFMAMSAMARDMNVASQNAKKLVEIMGGKPSSKEDKVAGSGLTEDERERKLKASIEKETKVTPVPKEEKKPGLASKAFEKLKSTKIGKKATNKIADLKKAFSPGSIFKSLSKYLAIGALIGVIFVAFKDSFTEWASGLWETIKESFGEFVEGIKKWFTEVVQPILDKIGGFIDEWIVQPIKNFFDGFVNFIKGYFEFMSNLITNPLETIKGVWEKFKAVVDGMIDKVANFYAGLKGPVKSVADALLPESIKKALQERVKAKEEAAVVDDSAEKKKLERQQAEVQETARIRKLEEEKGYKGEDEIVRARLGLPPKTETMRREEAKAAPAAPAPPPTVTPTPAPAAPAPAKPAIAAPAEPPPKLPPAAVPAPTPAPKAEKEAVAPSPSDTKPVKISAATGKSAMLKAMDDNKITDPTARAAIMAQVGHESGGFTTLSENLNYKGSSLMKLFKKYFGSQEEADQIATKGPAAIADRIYGGRMGNAPEGSGEGFKYRGRGFVQLTGKANYKKYGFENNPDEVASIQNAADTAIKYMMGYKGDWSDIVKVTKFVNGGTIGLEDRKKHFEEYLKDPSIIKVGAVQTTASGGGVSSASSEIASGQRAQAKPSTPVIVNAPTTNNQMVTQNQVQPRRQENIGGAMAARVA